MTIGCIRVPGRFLRTTAGGPRVMLCAVALGVGALSVGCGDMLSYSQESRQQGIDQYNQANYPQAAGAFDNAIKQDPRDYHSYYYLGRSYDAMRDYHQSVQAYRTALDVMARSLQGQEDKAFRQKVLDGIAAAAAAGNNRTLERAALQSPDQPTAEDQYLLAKIYRIHGDVDSAIDAYNQATLMEPSNLQFAKEFGIYLVQLGQTQKAAYQLKRAYVLNRRVSKHDDPEVIAAMRQVGVVPGPSLGDEKDLAQPIVPRGPLPEVDVTKIKLQNPFVEEGTSASGQGQ